MTTWAWKTFDRDSRPRRGLVDRNYFRFLPVIRELEAKPCPLFISKGMNCYSRRLAGRSAARCVPVSRYGSAGSACHRYTQLLGKDVGAGDRCSAAKCSARVKLHGCMPGEFDAAD